MGAQAWQLNILHFSILTSLIGKDGFDALYAAKDEGMAANPAITESFAILRALSENADPGNANRA